MKNAYILTAENGEILGLFSNDYKRKTLIDVIENHYSETIFNLLNYINSKEEKIFTVEFLNRNVKLYLTKHEIYN